MYSTLLATTLLAIAGSALGQDCAEAARFGTSFVESSAPDLAAGELITITSNFTCANAKGIFPSEVNYIIANTVNNNGHEPNIVVARRTNPGVVDTFMTNIPAYASYFPHANYSLVAELTYPLNHSAPANKTSYVVVAQPSIPLGIGANVS